jgi:phage terminase large subunit
MGKLKDITINDENFNSVYLPYLRNNNFIEIYYGGSSSGKSHFVSQKNLLKILSNPERNFLCTRKVGDTVKESCYNEILGRIKEWGLYKDFKATVRPLKIINKIHGNGFYFRGLDDSEKIKSIKPDKGIITDIWVEEATEISKKDLEQLKKRLRGKTKKKIFKQISMTFNPIYATHWIKKELFDKNLDYVSVLKTTYKDNKFLTDQDIWNLENTTDDKYYNDVYLYGNWGVLGNLIYTNYEVKPVKYHIKDFDYFAYGVDFGFTNPSAIIGVGIKDDKVYIKSEIYKNKLTNSELIQKCEILDKTKTLLCDSAEPDRIKEFKRAGFNARAVKKNKNSVKHGIDWLLSKKIIIDPACQNVINEIQQYKRKENKDGEALEEPLPINDHAMDAIRYSIDDLRTQNEVKFYDYNEIF